MPGRWRLQQKAGAIAIAGVVCLLLTVPDALAQSASYFSPTYAASEGSPYSEIYARTFGAGGPPQAPQSAPEPPLETAAPPPADADVVYVIEGGRLLTYSAAGYARGGAAALSAAPLPGDGATTAAPAGELPSIADRLYASPPLETAAGPRSGGGGAPIRLIPPQN